jgi:hypothetical protein
MTPQGSGPYGSQDTPQENISPARQRLLSFAAELRRLERLVNRLEGGLLAMEQTGGLDGDQSQRIVAAAGVCAREVSDAGALTARELEQFSNGARPATGFEIAVFREPKRRDPIQYTLGSLATIGFGGVIMASHHVAGLGPTVGTICGAVAMGAAWLLERPKIWRRR